METATRPSAVASAHKLKSFLLEKASTCLHQPEGLLKYKYVTPTYAVKAGADDTSVVSERSTVGHYLQMYDWDACFFSEAALQMGLGDLAPDVVANFLSLKHAEGYIPRTVSPERIWDAGDMCKPFLCQALVFNGQHRVRQPMPAMLADLECYLGYYRRTRRDQKTGLYRWRNVLESGVDDNLALLGPHEAAKDENEKVVSFPDSQLLAVDLSSYMVAEFRAFAQLAEAHSQLPLAVQYRKEADELAAAIEKWMWSDSHSIYYNVFDNGQQMPIKSWTGLTPVIVGASSAARSEQVIHNTMLNPDHFLRPTGICSTAASEPLYNNAKRGLYGRAIVSNWQGPMWILPNALAVRVLKQRGLNKEATDVSARVVQTVVAALDATGTTYENYNAETGQPLWAPQFMSWNSLAIELINQLES